MYKLIKNDHCGSFNRTKKYGKKYQHNETKYSARDDVSNHCSALFVLKQNPRKLQQKVIMSITVLPLCVVRCLFERVGMPRTRSVRLPVCLRLNSMCPYLTSLQTTAHQLQIVKSIFIWSYFSAKHQWLEERLIGTDSKQKQTFLIQIQIKIIIFFLSLSPRTILYFYIRTNDFVAKRMSEDVMTGKLSACNYVWKPARKKKSIVKINIVNEHMKCFGIKIKSEHRPTITEWQKKGGRRMKKFAHISHFFFLRKRVSFQDIIHSYFLQVLNHCRIKFSARDIALL